MPDKPFSWIPKEDLLSYEEMFRFIKLSIDSGVTKIRLTGGEPLVRDDLDVLVKMISDYAPDIDLALTTNGYLLPIFSQKLKDAGLKRVNISLDSLKSDTFLHISKKDALKDVLNGIDSALNSGLKVKINSVILEGINDNEIVDLFNFAKAKDVQIRFIEYMENELASSNLKTVPSSYIIEQINKQDAVLEEVSSEFSPARIFLTKSGYKFGIIEPHDDNFCKTCNRLRLSAEGDLIPCLYFEDAQSVKKSLKDNNLKKTEDILKDVVKNKPEKNKWSKESSEVSNRAFYHTGG
jgi:cyclic pyranopterin phosphate synthase